MKAPAPPPTPPLPVNEEHRTVYEQDGEFVRHHDGVKWNRFQLVAVIEGAALYASFQASGLSRAETVVLMAAATVVIGFIFVLAIVDSRATGSHLKRMRAYEKANGVEYRRPNLRPLFGFRTTRVAMSTILLFNVLVMARLALWAGGPAAG
ncbi:MAG TPA: hypothetical protein VIT45_13930 [Allosphingosinicella sp.]